MANPQIPPNTDAGSNQGADPSQPQQEQSEAAPAFTGAVDQDMVHITMPKQYLDQATMFIGMFSQALQQAQQTAQQDIQSQQQQGVGNAGVNPQDQISPQDQASLVKELGG